MLYVQDGINWVHIYILDSESQVLKWSHREHKDNFNYEQPIMWLNSWNKKEIIDNKEYPLVG